MTNEPRSWYSPENLGPDLAAALGALAPGLLPMVAPNVGGVGLIAAGLGAAVNVGQTILQQVGDRRRQKFITALARLENVDWETLLQHREKLEWLAKVLNKVREIKGEAKLTLLAAMAGGVLTAEEQKQGRSEDLWDIAAGLSYDELRVLVVVVREKPEWNVHTGYSGVTAETTSKKASLSPDLAHAYLKRLEGAGLVTERLSVETAAGSSGWGSDDEAITAVGLHEGEFRPTAIAQAMFTLAQDGGFRFHSEGQDKEH